MEKIAAPSELGDAGLPLEQRPTRKGPPSITLGGAASRDRAIVHWLGRHGAATLAQVRERFALSRTVAYRRLAACVEAGLVERVQLLHGQPALLRATARGLRYAGLSLPVARLSPELVDHWVACAWAAIRVPRRPDEALLSERELRFQERAEGRSIASATVGELPDGSPRLHRPDLVLVGARGVVAIEVELTPKTPRRLERIVRAWCRARPVESTRYYAPAGTVTRGLERAVERVRGEDRIEIRPLAEIV